MFRKKALNGWSIALINVCAITSIKNFPLLAEYGLSIIPFLALTALFFFIPMALVAAELASAWPDKGVYTWVRVALGDRLGFLAIWLQWLENVVWYPTILSFIAGAIAYLIDPALIENKNFVVSVILITFWTMTFVNLFGMRVSGLISSVSALFGTLIPIVVIIGLGIAWMMSGNPKQIEFSWRGIVPDLSSVNQLVLLSGVLLGLSGIEMSAVHAKDVVNPQREYPKGILYSTVMILVTACLGALSIAIVVPIHRINLASGSMEAFKVLFSSFGLENLMPVIAFMAGIGAIGMMSTWIVGPSRGLYATAEHGDLPPLFHKENRYGMPTNILLCQAFIVTALSLVFLYMPSINSSYWILIALASILYMIMYVLMFVSAIVLRRTQPKKERVFKVPFMDLVAGLGIFGSLFGIVIGFLPPTQIDAGSSSTPLLIGTLAFTALPLIVYQLRNPSWHLKK